VKHNNLARLHFSNIEGLHNPDQSSIWNLVVIFRRGVLFSSDNSNLPNIPDHLESSSEAFFKD